MPEPVRKEIEALADNLCGATIDGYGTPIPCDREKHDGDLHWNDALNVVWRAA